MTGLSCDDAAVLLTGWVDDELDGAEREALTAHLEGCADCRAELESLEALSALTADAAPLPSAAAWAAFDEELRGAVAAEPRGELIAWPNLVALGAIAAALLLSFRLVWTLSEPRVTVHAGGPLSLPALVHRDPVWDAPPEPRAPFDPQRAQGSEALAELGPAAVAALTSHGVVQVPGGAGLRQEPGGAGLVQVPGGEGLAALYPLAADPRGPAPLATADASLLLAGAVSGRLALTIERELIVPETRRLITALALELRRFELIARRPEVRRAARAALERAAVVALLEDAPLDLPVTGDPRVLDEVARIRAAAGPSASPLDGAVFDYARCRPRGLYVGEGDHARAMAWISQRGLRLGTAHPDELRAACLQSLALARAQLPDGRTALAAQARLEAALQVLYGEPDGLTPLDMLAAVRQGLGEPHPRLARLADPVDLAAIAAYAAELSAARRGAVRGPDDIGRGPGDAGRDDDGEHRAAGEPRAYLLGHLRSIEAQTLSALSGPRRPRPSSLDLLVLLGSRRARTAISAAGLDAPGYDGWVAALGPQLAAWADVGRPVPLTASLEQARLWALAPLIEPRAVSSEAYQSSEVYRDRLLLAALAGLNAPQPAPDVRLADLPRGPVPVVEPLPRLHARLAFNARRLHAAASALLDPSPGRERAVALLEHVIELEEALRDASLDALAGRRPADGTLHVLRGYVASLHELAPPHALSAEDVYVLGGEVLERVGYRLDRLVVTARDPLTWRPRVAIGAAIAATELLSPRPSTPLEAGAHPDATIPSWASHHLDVQGRPR